MRAVICRLRDTAGLLGRGSRIRTGDLQYPKLPRYQAALYPDDEPAAGIHSSSFASKPWQAGAWRDDQRRNIGCATRSPGARPSLRDVPAITSSTARTGLPDEIVRSDNGTVFGTIRAMVPSLRIKIMSRDM